MESGVEPPHSKKFGCGCSALRCLAELHSAIVRRLGALSTCERSAECNSAIQQTTSLRYGVAANYDRQLVDAPAARSGQNPWLTNTTAVGKLAAI